MAIVKQWNPLGKNLLSWLEEKATRIWILYNSFFILLSELLTDDCACELYGAYRPCGPLCARISHSQDFHVKKIPLNLALTDQ